VKHLQYFFFSFVKSLLCSAPQLGDPAVSYTQQMGSCLELGTETWKIFFVFKSVPNQTSTHSVRRKNIEQRGEVFHVSRNERQSFDLAALLPLKFSLQGDRFRERMLLKGF